jgi:hypothetical protein
MSERSLAMRSSMPSMDALMSLMVSVAVMNLL